MLAARGARLQPRRRRLGVQPLPSGVPAAVPRRRADGLRMAAQVMEHHARTALPGAAAPACLLLLRLPLTACQITRDQLCRRGRILRRRQPLRRAGAGAAARQPQPEGRLRQLPIHGRRRERQPGVRALCRERCARCTALQIDWSAARAARPWLWQLAFNSLASMSTVSARLGVAPAAPAPPPETAGRGASRCLSRGTAKCSAARCGGRAARRVTSSNNQ